MSDLISRQAVLDKAIRIPIAKIVTEDKIIYRRVVFVDEIEQMPNAEKTGHWIAIDEKPHEDYECDNCGYVVSIWTEWIEPHNEYKFCPNCGCRMIGGE